jgi:hypothetical protein
MTFMEFLAYKKVYHENAKKGKHEKTSKLHSFVLATNRILLKKIKISFTECYRFHLIKSSENSGGICSNMQYSCRMEHYIILLSPGRD